VLRDYYLSVARIKWASICLARSAIIRLLVPTLMLSSSAATKLARAYLYFFPAHRATAALIRSLSTHSRYDSLLRVSRLIPAIHIF
jgi:hypothetical protein